MNIRSGETYGSSFWDWTALNGCFAPTRIRVSDIDGIVERHGEFLWIETKYPGEPIEEGQAIMHAAAAATGRFTILLIWGEPNHPIKYTLTHGAASENGLVNTMAEIATVVRRWFIWAEGKATP